MRALLRLELTDRAGQVIDARQAHNAVMREGARLIAGLFAGGQGAITHMGVGISDEPESDTYNTLALTNPTTGDDMLQGDTMAPIPAEAMIISIDETRRVAMVRVRGTLPPDAAIGTITEAGLISSSETGDILYNRVTFAPVKKAGDHELTLFWEVTFPYGDLNWMA